MTALTRVSNGQDRPTIAEMPLTATSRFSAVVDEICDLDWQCLSAPDMISAAWAYYHVSIQFRENLQIARRLHPSDVRLKSLEAEECATDNLSPWPGVAKPGERIDHDEFLRRMLALEPVADARARELRQLGQAYLAQVRRVDETARAASIASYEDGGLEAVFRAMLRFSRWQGPVLHAFRHFLSRHVEFDSDLTTGHGALCRHLQADDGVLPLWRGFADLLVASVPALKR